MHFVKTTLLRSTGHIWVSKTSLFLFSLKHLIMQLLGTLTKLAMQTGAGGGGLGGWLGESIRNSGILSYVQMDATTPTKQCCELLRPCW